MLVFSHSSTLELANDSVCRIGVSWDIPGSLFLPTALGQSVIPILLMGQPVAQRELSAVFISDQALLGFSYSLRLCDSFLWPIVVLQPRTSPSPKLWSGFHVIQSSGTSHVGS